MGVPHIPFLIVRDILNRTSFIRCLKIPDASSCASLSSQTPHSHRLTLRLTIPQIVYRPHHDGPCITSSSTSERTYTYQRRWRYSHACPRSVAHLSIRNPSGPRRRTS